jgi:hypothetical protein
MPNNRFKEQANAHDAVTTYANTTEALGGETSDTMVTAFYDMENYDAMLGICIAQTVVATHILTFQMYEATDTDGGGSATIAGASLVYTSSQVTDVYAGIIEVDADQLTDGSDFVGLRVTTDDADGSEAVAIEVIPSSARYPQATPVA